jgi:hypothetical protein
MAPDTAAYNATYRVFIAEVAALNGRGLSAAVYTQVSDVEGEVNGVMTYDRAVVKLSPESVRANQRVIAIGSVH